MLGKQISAVVGMVLFFACQAQEAKVAPTLLPPVEEEITEIAPTPAKQQIDTTQHLAHYDSLLLNILNKQTSWSERFQQTRAGRNSLPVLVYGIDRKNFPSMVQYPMGF